MGEKRGNSYLWSGQFYRQEYWKGRVYQWSDKGRKSWIL
jgi:hypothetical protein